LCFTYFHRSDQSLTNLSPSFYSSTFVFQVDNVYAVLSQRNRPAEATGAGAGAAVLPVGAAGAAGSNSPVIAQAIKQLSNA
jgi:hypothetical protein